MSSDCQVRGETQRDATRPPRDAAPAHSMPVNGSPRHLSRGIRHAIFLTRSDLTRLLSLTGHLNCRAIFGRSTSSGGTIGVSDI